MCRDDTLTVESLDGNILYLDLTIQFRIYNFTTHSIVKNCEIEYDHSLLEDNMISI